jgi:hypothetical protein
MSPCLAADTLKGTADIQDCIIYSYQNCNDEITGEDCRRYNAGSITNLQVGSTSAGDRRAIIYFPGWNDSLPDSAQLQLYLKGWADEEWRNIFIYPLTKQGFEGSELSYNLGDYPNPDSGATWNHASLDVGVPCSLSWTSPGADYITTIADTIAVQDQEGYHTSFNYILLIRVV